MDHFTDDSVLTFALAEWALEYGKVPLGDCDAVADLDVLKYRERE